MQIGTTMKHLFLRYFKTHPSPLKSRRETRSGGQFYWGGILLKSNAGVQRCTRLGWKSSGLCNGISALNCESDSSSRCESRS